MTRLLMLKQAVDLAIKTLVDHSTLSKDEYVVKSGWEDQEDAVTQLAYDFLMEAAQVLADQQEAAYKSRF